MLDTPETNHALKYEWRRVVRPLIDDLHEAGETEFLYNYAMQMLEKCNKQQQQRAIYYATLLRDAEPEEEAE